MIIRTKIRSCAWIQFIVKFYATNVLCYTYTVNMDTYTYIHIIVVCLLAPAQGAPHYAVVVTEEQIKV